MGIPITDIPTLWREVIALAFEMQRKLNLSLLEKKKTGWDGCNVEYLITRLKQEVRELEDAIDNGGDIVGEAADVANFAMMIADLMVWRKQQR